MTAAAMVGAGLLAAAPAQSVAPQAAPAVAPAEVVGKKKAPKDALKVLTLNLYLGGSLGPAIEAIETGGDFFGELKNLYDTVQKTDFPLRAKTIAQTVKKQNPDILTLNELSNWVIVKKSDGSSLENYDYLKILTKELNKAGMKFKVASLVDNAALPPISGVGLPYVDPAVGCSPLAEVSLKALLAAPCQIAFKDRDAVLYNTKSKKLKPLKAKAKGTFKTQDEYDLLGQKISFSRGWASRAFTWQGKPFTMMTSHLEVESQDGKGTPGATGIKNWPSKVQVAQGKELVKIAKKAATKTDGRVVLAGDLNSDANNQYSPTYKNLTKWFGDSYLQAGGKTGKEVGATCCHAGTLDSPDPLDSGDPVVPTRIDLVLTRKATGVRGEVIENTFQDSQPIWQSDHYFYSAAVTLK
jgi:endonuclease/exonuclease/phosphatase family metal-dependent hydrolase